MTPKPVASSRLSSALKKIGYREKNRVLKPITPEHLNKMLEKLGHDEQKKQDLRARTQEYNQALFQFTELKRNSEWKLILDPSLFKRAEQKLKAARKDLTSGHVLDTKSSDWAKHRAEYTKLVEELKEPRINEKRREKFIGYFEGQEQKAKAAEFIAAYNSKMAALEQEREEWKNLKDNQGNPLYDPIMEAEVEKQLKIVQAHVIQAMQAVMAAERAKKLGLAKEALTGVGLALAGAGIGMTIAAAAGSVVPVWGTAAAAAAGALVGGIYGGIRGYRGYETAKVALQARVDRVLGAITEYPKADNAVYMNPGIAQLKSPETFAWLLGGPREADYQRMYKIRGVRQDTRRKRENKTGIHVTE